tara:strand:+ start:15817 stop:16995 length:1179 start_codon:yes stop_codon:yes gene_type:complete
LLFQALDNKQECYKIFCDNSLIEDYRESDLTHTWAPTPHFSNKNIEYAQIWCGGKSLSEVCPEPLKDRFQSLNEQAKTYFKTFYNAKINLSDICFYDLVPKSFLLEFYDLKNQITKHVFSSYKRPRNYNFSRDLLMFIKDIEQRDLNIDFEGSDFSSMSVRAGSSKIKKHNTKIVYNPWKTVTGRLTTEKNSFPILTLNKELRQFIKPKNDVFVELDFNSAELRVLIGLLNQKQPDEDIHHWINKNVFSEKHTRDEVKKKVFGWLYNPKAKNKKLNEYLNRDKILENFFSNGRVTTPYGRSIEVDEDKAVNYLVQSTSSDMLLTSAILVNNELRNKRSFVSFCIHDSIVIDMCKEEKNLLVRLAEIFSHTKFGDLKFNLSVGKNFGAMEKVL